MMKSYLTLILTATLVLTQANDALALERNTKMGKPTQEEMQMTVYEPDPDADAVVLYSRTDAQYEWGSDDFRMHYYYRVRIKVLTPEGVDKGNVEIAYYNPEDAIRSEEKIFNMVGIY